MAGDPAREAPERWVRESGYTRAMDVRVERLDAEGARLRLPFRDEHTNPGHVLHGGVAASMIEVAAQSVARAALGAEAAPLHSAQVQVAYLAAARAQAVVAEARLLRRGKQLCFADVSVRAEDEREVARGVVCSRAAFGRPPALLPRDADDPGGADPGVLGPHIEKVPFMARLGLRVEHMADGRSRIALPWRDENGDVEGGTHPGAVLALLDTTGAMAAWAVTGAGPYKASTPSLQAQFLSPAPAEDLVAHGRCVQRSGNAFWSDVEVVAARDRRLVARGTVFYRIDAPEAPGDRLG